MSKQLGRGIKRILRVTSYNCLAENSGIYARDEGKQLHTSPADTGIDMEEPSFPQDACKLGKKPPAFQAGEVSKSPVRICIDISQIAHQGTGVSSYTEKLVENLLKFDKENEYTLFFSSLRKNLKPPISNIKEINPKVKIKTFKLPPSLLDILWNRLHIFPIEWFIGEVDVLVTSDWTEPPTIKAKKMTILYDLVVYKYPEGMDKKIVETQKRKLAWVKKESEMIICISEETKKDAMAILGIEEKRLKVVYPGGL